MTPHNASAPRESKVSNIYSWVADYTETKDDKPESPERPHCTPSLQDFIQTTGVATRGWLLQQEDEREGEEKWGWGRLREEPEGDLVGR